MSLLRRIVVVSNHPQLRDMAQEVAHEVFVADDLAEAVDIVNTVTPEMTLFDPSFAPGHGNDPFRPILRPRAPA